MATSLEAQSLPTSPNRTSPISGVVPVALDTPAIVSEPTFIATLKPAPVYDNTTTVRASNATCTVHIPDASIDYWYAPTYSHVLGTMTTAASNFTNAESYTLVPHTATFDVESALVSDFACTTSTSYVAEWDWTMSVCVEYTDKPTAAATSLAYRSAAAPFPPDGIIPVSDALLYDLYTDGRPSATTTISLAPNVTETESSATPFVHFTAYEVASGNSTETFQLRAASIYPYWLKGIERKITATGPLPSGFLEQIRHSACDPGQLQGVVTVVIVVDLYYQNSPNANPFIVHFESTALGFDDPTVGINNHGTSKLAPLTIADWDLPGAPPKTTSASIKPHVIQSEPQSTSEDDMMFNAGGEVTDGRDFPLPTGVVVGTIGTDAIVIGPSSQIIVGSQTLSPGGSAITVGDDVPVSLPSSAGVIVVDGMTSQLPHIANPSLQPLPRPPPVLTIGSSTLTPNAATQFFIQPGQTLTPEGVATVDGTVVSLAPSASFLVVGGVTQVLPTPNPGRAPAPTHAPEIVVGGSTFTAHIETGGLGMPAEGNPSARPTFIISDQTLQPGGPPITAAGAILSLGPSGSFVVVNGVTSTIPNPAATADSSPPLTIGTDVFVPIPGLPGTNFIIRSQTLAAGGSAITVSGTTISLAPAASFVVINGVTSTLPNLAHAQVTPPPLTIGDRTFEPLPGTVAEYLIGSLLLTPGGSIVVADSTIVLAPGATALIINGQTSLISTPRPPVMTNPPLLTVGSQTYTAIPGAGTMFVIGDQSLTPGGIITVDGTTISLSPSATELAYGSAGRSTSTALFPATTTQSKSSTQISTLSNPGASGNDGQAAATSQRQSFAYRSSTHGWIISSFVLITGLLWA